MKKEVGNVQKAPSEERTEIRGALDKEKLERKGENKARKQENEALENRIEGRLESEIIKIEDELNSIKMDIKSMKTARAIEQCSQHWIWSPIGDL